jgi:predicted NBD/HSP70 family sugar kinase
MIAIRTGVGGGFVVDNRLYHGLHFAGEIGHIPNPLKSNENNGVLESAISLPALKFWYKNRFNQACPEVDNWGKLLEQKDPNITSLFHHVLDHLVPTFELLIKILDVPKIIVASSWRVSQQQMDQLLKEKNFLWEGRILFENFDTDQFVSASAFLVQKPLFL